jgi:small subunit ribosomal protein S6e
MVEYKLVIGAKDGKCHQVELKDEKAEALHDRHLGETIPGDSLGFEGYEFLITGGSDKCGFPMRKGIQDARKKVLIGGSVGFNGKKRPLRKKSKRTKQNGLVKRRTVCGERISKIIRQVNVKVVKVGAKPLGEAPAEVAAESDAKKE